jgi:predicted phosphodiesterase
VQQASGDVRRLVDFCRARPRSLRDVCDHLGCSPKAAEFLYEQARANGYSVDLSGAEIAWRRVDVNERTTRAKIEPVAGEYHVGVMSDTHYGSKYCEPDWIEDWVERAYTKGVRRIVHAGDLLAGQSEKIRWDLSHHGLDAQCQEAFERLPKRPGLEYHFIDGNHDEHFRNLVGQETGYRVVEYFKARGRHDVVCAGQRAGLVLLEAPVCKRPIVVKLWHPKAGKSYAISYQPQNHIRDMGVGVKPDVLVCGHWHVAGYFCQRGVHALLGGTFENPGSSFSKSLGGAVANGATILSFGITEHGTIRDLEYKWTSYYVEERARSLELSPAGIAISKRQDEVLAEALLSLQQLVGALRGEVS